jgi:hypothetical protein
MTTTTAIATAVITRAPAKVLDDDTVRPGWLGLLVFLALAAATFVLVRSFMKQLKRIQPMPSENDELDADGNPTGRQIPLEKRRRGIGAQRELVKIPPRRYDDEH